MELQPIPIPTPAITPTEIDARLERILLRVQKPGRYVGGEYNQVVKDWTPDRTKIALVFPDIYDLGLPNLGLAILYDLLNQRAEFLAERAYCPWLDMEALMREHAIPLYSLESKHALLDFDLVAFTLPYETLYTNVLNALDLAGIPLRSTDRGDSHPLVIAGGHAAFNPEPMNLFIDAFVIGEGEEVMLEVAEAVRAARQAGLPRAATLLRLAQIPGVYVPSLVEVSYHPDGAIDRVTPAAAEVRLPVVKRIVGALPPPTTRFLVPTVDTVHNRIAIEIMRGCTRGCRFCHAGMINRPVRERPLEEVVQAIEDAVNATGYQEIGLLSLSSSDYTQIVDLVDAVSQRFAGQQLTVALPSLRIDSFSVDLMDRLKELRPGGGFTLAPEAATERMRRIINKPVSTEQLLETAHAIYQHGWTTIKLYFMIGHPSETLEDVQAIAELCKAVLAVGKRTIGGRARVHAGVSTFVPKAHTPFQWAPCDEPDLVRQKQDLLKRELRNPNIKLTWTDPQDTLLEAWLSRGDRRLGEVIETAWRNGAKFDAWQDQYRYPVWEAAFAQHGLDPAFYSHRPRGLEETLPWDHISAGVRKRYLVDQYHASQAGEFAADCRGACVACGILPQFAGVRRTNPGKHWLCPEVSPRDRRPVGRVQVLSPEGAAQ